MLNFLRQHLPFSDASVACPGVAQYRVLILHASTPAAHAGHLQHCSAFPANRPDTVFLFHHFWAPITEELRSLRFDALIVNYDFLNQLRSRNTRKRADDFCVLSKNADVRIALPQDDYSASSLLDEWLDIMDIHFIYTLFPDYATVLYPRMAERADFRSASTFYLDEALIEKGRLYARPFHEREIDYGNRVMATNPHTGRWGRTKSMIPLQVADRAREDGFIVDVSTSNKDRFHGDNWLKFLGNTRFIDIIKGGSSINDMYGDIRGCVNKFLQNNPDANFEDVEAACFPGVDGKYYFKAFGPRFLQAAILGTVRLMPPDTYPGELEPYVHYLPLKEDLSNVDEILDIMKDTERCSEISKNAYNRTIETDYFWYNKLVERIFDDIKSKQRDVNFFNRSRFCFRTIGENKKIDRHFSKLNEACDSLSSMDVITRMAFRHIVRSVEKGSKQKRVLDLIAKNNTVSPRADVLRATHATSQDPVTRRALTMALGHPAPQMRDVMKTIFENLANGKWDKSYVDLWDFCCVFYKNRCHKTNKVWGHTMEEKNNSFSSDYFKNIHAEYGDESFLYINTRWPNINEALRFCIESIKSEKNEPALIIFPIISYCLAAKQPERAWLLCEDISQALLATDDSSRAMTGFIEIARFCTIENRVEDALFYLEQAVACARKMPAKKEKGGYAVSLLEKFP